MIVPAVSEKPASYPLYTRKKRIILQLPISDSRVRQLIAIGRKDKTVLSKDILFNKQLIGGFQAIDVKLRKKKKVTFHFHFVCRTREPEKDVKLPDRAQNIQF